MTPIARATDLSRIAIYIALTADRNPAFPTLSRIARARTEAPVHGVSPATAHMPRIVHTIRPRSHHRRSVPAAPLDKTANLLEHCRSNARRRETVNRTELCARIAARSTSTRADAATARRVGAAIPAPGKPSPSPPAPLRRSRPARPFAAGSTDSMASARFGGTRSAANRSPGGHAFSRPTRRDETPPIRRCLREFSGTVAPADPTLTARLRLPCRRRLGVDCLRGAGRLWQRGNIANLSICRACEHMRSPRADIGCLRCRHSLIQRDVNCLLRQRCTRVRAPNIGPASEPLTAAGVQMPEYCVRTSRAESPVPYTRRPCDHQFHLAVTFMKETVSTSIEGRLQTPPANCRL